MKFGDNLQRLKFVKSFKVSHYIIILEGVEPVVKGTALHVHLCPGRLLSEETFVQGGFIPKLKFERLIVIIFLFLILLIN